MPACLILGLERGDVHISPYLPTSYKDAGPGGKARLVPKSLHFPLLHTTSCPTGEWRCHTPFSSLPSCEVGWQLTTDKGAAGDMRVKNKLHRWHSTLFRIEASPWVTFEAPWRSVWSSHMFPTGMA